METNLDRLEVLRTTLEEYRELKREISEQVLQPQYKDKIKALLDQSADMSLKIEKLEEEIREVEFPHSSEASINPWQSL